MKAALLVFCGASLLLAGAVAARGSEPPNWNPAVGEWLPDPESGFDAWSKGHASLVDRYDYFVCGSTRTPSEKKESFYYAGSACPLVKSGTAFAYGAAEPIKGNVMYDSARGIAFFDKGCCAWRGFALTAHVAKPPKPVAGADLSAVSTMRGVSLGMTMAGVERIYGPAKPHPTKGVAGATTLTYTTMKGTPTKPAGDACGQFQSFSFRADRLFSIELLVGC